MSISRNLDAHEDIANFDRAYVGPGVYVLFDGRIADSNIVYIGKSARDVLMRVDDHRETKRFNKVGVILPRRTDELVIHNLEHYVLCEFLDCWGELPAYNTNNAHLHPHGPNFNWHLMGRRPNDAYFGGADDRRDRQRGTRAETVGEIRRLAERVARQNPNWPMPRVWDEVARRLGDIYSPTTIRQYCSVLHGNVILAERS
jgi:hypothetical protein